VRTTTKVALSVLLHTRLDDGWEEETWEYQKD